MTVAETIKYLDMELKVRDLKRELADCRNELCLKCGRYSEAHLGACSGCRWENEYGEYAD